MANRIITIGCIIMMLGILGYNWKTDVEVRQAENVQWNMYNHTG